MNKTFICLSFTAAIVFSASSAYAQTIWNGPPLDFSKAAFADQNLPSNQDQIVSSVHLTRASVMGLFNIAQESSFITPGPSGTEWAFGTTDDIGSLTFLPWRDWHGDNPPSAVDRDAVLHLIEDDIFIDIRFTEWGQGNFGGGSFAYTRSTEPSTVLKGDVNLDEVVSFDDIAPFIVIATQLSTSKISQCSSPS